MPLFMLAALLPSHLTTSVKDICEMAKKFIQSNYQQATSIEPSDYTDLFKKTKGLESAIYNAQLANHPNKLQAQQRTNAARDTQRQAYILFYDQSELIAALCVSTNGSAPKYPDTRSNEPCDWFNKALLKDKDEDHQQLTLDLLLKLSAAVISANKQKYKEYEYCVKYSSGKIIHCRPTSNFDNYQPIEELTSKDYVYPLLREKPRSERYLQLNLDDEDLSTESEHKKLTESTKKEKQSPDPVMSYCTSSSSSLTSSTMFAPHNRSSLPQLGTLDRDAIKLRDEIVKKLQALGDNVNRTKLDTLLSEYQSQASVLNGRANSSLYINTSNS